jgi:DNA processing protein
VIPEKRLLIAGEAGFPARLLELDKPPARLTVAGEMTTARTIAVVGTRRPTAEAVAFTRELAAVIVQHGGIVASGGAAGIDGAAHEGALDAGGATWVVAATGPDEVFPRENAPLFARVVAEGGVMIWPFAEGKKASPLTFFARNGILVALANALVIVQANVPSGTMNAARWARKLGRPVWAVCAPPWVPGFLGCSAAIELGAKPFVSMAAWLRAVGFVRGRRATATPTAISTSTSTSTKLDLAPDELALLSTLSLTKHQHIDEIAAKSGLSAQAVATALLTLTLENVVVEGPEGLFRLATTR